ncbi:MAG: SagB/ThcOx family dehydrogenase [Candidatus Micrarchaeia archaeon]
MLKDVEEFYKKTKLTEISLPKGKAPIEYIHVFHKEYPRFYSIKLPRSSKGGEYNKLLNTRKSVRLFSNKFISIQTLANIFKSCAIIKNNPERRCYPSAGVRFPIEIYLVAFRIKNLKPGAYHLNIKKFSLELLLKTNLRKYEQELVSPFLNNTAGIIILTSAISRSEVKYGYKSYPFSLLEAGHISQNILLSCTKYNVGSCPVG